MAEKRGLDEIDLNIVRLLAEDARRPYSDIATRVDRSAPAVSDRIDRLHEQGVIRRFTVDLDRTKLAARRPILIEITATIGESSSIGDTLGQLDGVEHVFETVEGRIIAFANAPTDNIGTWVGDAVDQERISAIDVSIVDRYSWGPGLERASFSLPCPVCDNPVTESGVTAEIGGETKAFCCPSCLTMYRERYQEHQSQAD